MVYTVRFAGGRGGRNAFEQELHDRHAVQKNSRPGHPTTCGKAERFQQTMKNWLAAQPVQPDTIADLQTLLDVFAVSYNHQRPHRSLPHRATPATLYDTMPKAVPGEVTDPVTHDRIRHDTVDKAGSVTLRYRSRLHHIGIGRTHAGTCDEPLTFGVRQAWLDQVTGPRWGRGLLATVAGPHGRGTPLRVLVIRRSRVPVCLPRHGW
jgi:hypothetical protein